jgi:hypothetical protein
MAHTRKGQDPRLLDLCTSKVSDACEEFDDLQIDIDLYFKNKNSREAVKRLNERINKIKINNKQDELIRFINDEAKQLLVDVIIEDIVQQIQNPQIQNLRSSPCIGWCIVVPPFIEPFVKSGLVTMKEIFIH